MSDIVDRPDLEQAAESARTMAKAGKRPPTYWMQITNVDPGTTFVVVPQDGNLWVRSDWNNAEAQQIGVRHQDGRITPINPGENNVAVRRGDILYYALSSLGSQRIKIGYQLT